LLNRFLNSIQSRSSGVIRSGLSRSNVDGTVKRAEDFPERVHEGVSNPDIGYVNT